MKQMAFSATRAQLLNGTKTVTRRTGWRDARAGDIVTAVFKAQGLKKGEHVEVLCYLQFVSVRREPLELVTPDDVAREGFPGQTTEWFICRFGEASGLKRTLGLNPKDWGKTEVTRIEFKRWRPPLLPPEPIQRGLQTPDFQRGLFHEVFAPKEPRP